MNRVSDNYADGLEIRIKELIAERDALAAKLAGIEVQLTQAFVHTAKLALQEPVAYEIEATRFANGKQLTYDKPSNLPGYITYRPLYAALSGAPAPQAQEPVKPGFHDCTYSYDKPKPYVVGSAALANAERAAQSVPEAQHECLASIYSSSVCVRGVKGCTVDHGTLVNTERGGARRCNQEGHME